jgi:cell division protein FtsW (lipid II flippase)
VAVTQEESLAVSITPLAGGLPREGSVAWPSLLEVVLTAAVVALLFPLFVPLAAQDTGRDARFAAPAAIVRGLPDAVLPDVCAAYGARAEDFVRERLCGRDRGPLDNARIDRIPPLLTRAVARATRAFVAPLEEAQARVTELRQQQRDGAADLLTLDHAIDTVQAEFAPYARHYALSPAATEGPRPLTCALESLQAAIANTAVRSAAARDTLRANAVLLFGAALDGHAATSALASAATLSGTRLDSARCAGIDMAEAIAATAALMADARSVPTAVAKNEAMRELLKTARWQWAGAAGLGLLMLNFSRRRGSPAIGIALALAAWGAAAWAGRVPWPLGGEHTLTLARPTPSFDALPAAFILWMLAAALCVLALAPWMRRVAHNGPQAPASIFGYPGLVLATGIGWLLLLDLSANGHFGNRYLALYHQGHFWLAMCTFSVLLFLRQPLGRALAWLLSLVDGASTRVAERLGALGAAVVLLSSTLLVTLAIAVLLLNLRQLTSELGRLWLMLGAAWFFFLRGTPLTERLARSGSSLGSLIRYVWPLLFVVIVLIGAMIVTRDMGPLLIAGYGAGAFVAASVAMWRYQRSGSTGQSYVLAVALFVAWIAVTTLALLRLGAIDDVTAARLENASVPFASANDHLALVTWFQRVAPAAGFGPGAVPWCGFGASGSCAGVPAQIQSDYTFTALIGMFGWPAAWAITIGCVLWLYAVLRPHGAASRGEPRLVRSAGRIGNDEQGFVSWLCVTWAVLALCQLAVTVAGNLAVIPLTGVTFPFVSFGMTSLIVNMAMLALAINVNRPDQRG